MLKPELLYYDIQNQLKDIHHFLCQDISLFYYISPISTILSLSCHIYIYLKKASAHTQGKYYQ